MKDIHVILHEKPFMEGLDRTEAIDMIDALINPSSFVPIEIEAGCHDSSAMGFIDTDVLNELSDENNSIEKMKEFIAGILDDMEKETEDGMYVFNKYNIYMTR